MSVVKKRDQLNIKKVAKNFNDNQAKLHFWGDISEKKVNLATFHETARSYCVKQNGHY